MARKGGLYALGRADFGLLRVDILSPMTEKTLARCCLHSLSEVQMVVHMVLIVVCTV